MADEHPECAAWAARGECGKNPGYMLEACRETCAALSAAAQSPTPHAQESHTEARNPAVWACLLASAALFAACVGGGAPRAFARGRARAPRDRARDRAVALGLVAHYCLNIASRYLDAGPIALYEGLWVCSCALLLAALGVVDNRPGLVACARARARDESGPVVDDAERGEQQRARADPQPLVQRDRARVEVAARDVEAVVRDEAERDGAVARAVAWRARAAARERARRAAADARGEEGGRSEQARPYGRVARLGVRLLGVGRRRLRGGAEGGARLAAGFEHVARIFAALAARGPCRAFRVLVRHLSAV